MPEKRISRYELLEEIGRGNMGVVHKARDPTIDRIVAIKVLRLGFPHDDAGRRTFLERFRREAKIAGRLNHPHIASLYDVGPSRDRDEPYLVMEYFPGLSLSQLLQQVAPEGGGLRDVKEVRLITRQLASALAYAHREGVVHRDVKPANVLYQPGPVIKLVDFGIAKFEALELTATGEFIGTPSYMSPEIFAGDRVDGRSDLFSLGVILYQLLTGKRPFEADSVSRTIYRVLHEEPTPPSKLRASLPPSWDCLCARLLAKDPARRYPRGEELIDDLDALGRGEPLRALPNDEPTEPIRPPRTWRRRTGYLAVLALVLAALAGWLSTGREPPPSAGSVDALVASAERALERGDLDETGSLLNAIRAHEPRRRGLEALTADLESARFRKSLPLGFVARHEHRVGYCTGDLELGADGVAFHSSRHGRWSFGVDEIEELRRLSRDTITLRVASREDELTLTFLRPPLEKDTFARYLEVLSSARDATPSAAE